MADMSTGIQMPAGAASAGNEPVIHVIPEKFYGAGVKMKSSPLPPTPPGPPQPPLPNTPVSSPSGAPKKKSRLPLFIGIGVGFLALIGIAAFFLLRAPAPAPVANTNVAVVPKGPVCGDAKCDAPMETVENCSADCKPPAPACGDAKCDSPGETTESCAADCKPPAPACGDAKCESPETFQSCAEDCKPPEPEPGTDNDSDGLSDQEEREVFGTDPSSPNTDKDSFVDLNEALNLFDPAKAPPSSLKDNPRIATYSDVASGYSLLRPAAWIAKDATPDKPETMFSAPSGEFVVVLVEEKPEAQALMDWYLVQAPGVSSSQVEPYKTRSGYDAILSPDRMTAYVDFGDRVVVVSYNLGSQLKIQYRVTFQVMVQSLVKQ